MLIATPNFGTTNFDEILDHWIDVLAAACDGDDCDLDPNIPVEPGNCDDCIDNDLDASLDTDDLFCEHRSDFGCDNFGDHNHRWEDSKDFAMMPDIEWCTTMQQSGMPWHAEVNMKAATAAAMLNAIPKALAWMHEQGLEQNVETPDNLATIQHRLSYCVFAESVAAASACVNDENACPSIYHLGGVTHLLPAYDDDASDAYMQKLWAEFDQATLMLEDEGITPKPVAMLSSVYSGDLVDGIKSVIGYSGSIGAIGWFDPGRLGATVVESGQFVFANVAHEFGHTLGLSHTIDNGPPVSLGGFMQSTSPFPLVSLLGPSKNGNEGYKYSNQWSNWAVRIGDKIVPRPNAFAWTGCNDDDDCPGLLSCWFFVANTPGVCLRPI